MDRTVVFKAHPLVGATGFDFGEVALEITTDSVAQLLRRAGVLITGSSGSTVLEALSQGILTLCVLDPAELDMSTIRDHDLLQTVGTADEFHRSLNHLLQVPASAHLTENFFHVEPTLARWRKLLRLVESPK
jgi:surface carbohydrate biosynthesis protein (TIGR04326 family)